LHPRPLEVKALVKYYLVTLNDNTMREYELLAVNALVKYYLITLNYNMMRENARSKLHEL